MTDKIKVKDAHEADKKIPVGLVIQYQGKPYATKAALEWKAMYLYGGGNFGVETQIVSITESSVVVKATFKTKDGITYSNYGEASKLNTNSMMQKYLLHLAVTRAECRVLRMATACAYASIEEMDIGENGIKELPASDKDGEKPTQAQISTLQKMGVKETPETYGTARAMIAEKVEGK